MLQRLHPADAETFLQNLLPVSPVSVSQTQETSRQTTQSIDTPKSIVTPQPTVIPIVARMVGRKGGRQICCLSHFVLLWMVWEQIEALSGYFAPRDCGEWCDEDVTDVVEGYYDTLRPDVAEGGFVFPRPDFGVDTETVHRVI